MKLIFAILMVMVLAQFAQASGYVQIYGPNSTCFADPTADICLDRGSNHVANTQVCQAKDADGAQYKYTLSDEFSITLAKRRALENCIANSTSPASCKITFCYKY